MAQTDSLQTQHPVSYLQNGVLCHWSGWPVGTRAGNYPDTTCRSVPTDRRVV
jgi:hypothetical protein